MVQVKQVVKFMRIQLMKNFRIPLVNMAGLTIKLPSFLTLKLRNGVSSTSKVDQPQHFLEGSSFLVHGIQEPLGLQESLLLAQVLQL